MIAPGTDAGRPRAGCQGRYGRTGTAPDCSIRIRYSVKTWHAAPCAAHLAPGAEFPSIQPAAEKVFFFFMRTGIVPM